MESIEDKIASNFRRQENLLESFGDAKYATKRTVISTTTNTSTIGGSSSTSGAIQSSSSSSSYGATLNAGGNALLSLPSGGTSAGGSSGAPAASPRFGTIRGYTLNNISPRSAASGSQGLSAATSGAVAAAINANGSFNDLSPVKISTGNLSVGGVNLGATLAAERDREWRDATIIAKLRKDLGELTQRGEQEASAFKSKLAALETRAVGAESALERLQRDLGIASSDAQQQRDAANRLRDELQAAEGRYRAKVAELDDALVQGRNAKNYREELSRASEANETITLRLSQRDNEVVSLKRSFEEQSAQAREARETVAMLKTDLVRVTQERDGALERARHALSRAREVEEESHRDLAERDERLAATKSRLVAANERASEAEADRSRLLAALSHEGRHFATVLDAISEITNLVTSQRDSARELASLEARMGKLQSESQIEGDKAAAARRDLVHQLDLERSRIAEAEETVTRLVREKAAVTEKAETAVRARDRAHEELEQATHALAASEARCEEQARALRDAEAQLASLTESERSLRDQVRRLRERADAAGEVEETLNRTVISQRAELEQALVEINALAAELAEANEARSRSRTTITHLEERITEYSRTEEVSLRERDVTIEELRRFAEDLGLVFSASSLSSAAGASLTSALRGALGEFAGAAKARLAAKDRDLDACLSFMSALLRRLEEARARGLYATSASSASSAHAHGDEAVSVFASSSSSSSSSSATGITSFAGLKAGITEAANAIVTARDALNQDASELREHVAALEKRSAQLNAQLAATADSEARARAEIRTLSAELETATSTASDHHVAAEGYRGLVEVLARVLAPTHARLQELLVQKHYLVQELRAKDALAREILSLKARLAPPASSTAGGNERDGAASAPRPPRAVSMRGAAIAVLASRRLAALGRLPHHPANIFLSGSLTPVLPASAVASLSTSGLSLGGSVRDEVGSVRALLSSLASRFGPGGVDTVMPFRFLTPPARSHHHHHHHQQLSGRQHYSGVGSGGYARFPPATRWALLTFSSLAADLNTVSVTYRSEITRLDNSVRKAESLLSRSQEINIALEERVHSLSSVVSEREEELKAVARELHETSTVVTLKSRELQQAKGAQEKEIAEALGHMRLLRDRNDRLAKALIEAENALRERDAQLAEYVGTVQRHYRDKAKLEEQERALLSELRSIEEDVITIGNHVNTLL